jgi:hypothetical protein
MFFERFEKYLKTTSVMAGLKREARLRAYVPAIHVFLA